jgi:structural maintenance of chromosome 3 (chondroitin sulfate proteoglycan 6)
MHIKRVIIRGFKTYKNETIIEDFSPHCNVVVGRNGSGKSNFFAAIRFVLSDAYTNMSREERQSLIHESSVNIMSAFVEIVFDNTDRRIPLAKDEVSIRRTIGMKKDDYSLDYKSATKSDIMNLLEASGFSKSNPYYIVPQGKVTALTNAKDSERLDLLKDVAGARVFENKLKDSQKEMAITAQKQDQIREMLTDIERRLNELDIEKEDLRAFETLNSKKKMLEFNIYDRELKALSDQIDTIESKYSNSAQETESLITDLEERESKIADLEDKLTDFRSKEKVLAIDLAINEKEKQDFVQQIFTANAHLREAKINAGSSQSSDVYVEKINSLKKEIEDKRKDISYSRLSLKSLKTSEKEINNKINELKQKQISIISKKNQKSKFASKTERDRHIKEEIDFLNSTKSDKEQDASKYKRELSTLKKSHASLLSEKTLMHDDTVLVSEMSILNNEISSLKSEARTLVDERSILWRKESRLSSIILAKEESISSLEQPLRNSTDNVSLDALDTIKSIAHKLGPNIESGIYGYLGELIDVSEKYKTAADVVGGNSLFHIVVNNDQTASILIEELKKVKRSRTTFIPLNRLKNEDFPFPQRNDSVPLIKKIAYDEYLAPAVKQVFGRTVVCMDIHSGYELASAYRVTAVTLDGDRCDNNGVLTGGFRDVKVSKIDYLKSLRVLKGEIAGLKEELRNVKDEINSKDFAINRNFQKTQKLKDELDVKLSEKSELLTKSSRIDSSISKIENDISATEQKIDLIIAAIDLIDQKVKNYNDEIGSSFSQTSFTETDEILLKEIHEELPILEKEHHEIMSQIEPLELTVSSLSTMLSEVMVPRLNQLISELETMDESHKDANYILEDITSRIGNLQERKAKIEEEEHTNNAKLSEIRRSIEWTTEQINEMSSAQENFIKQFEDVGKSTDKNLAQRLRLRNRKYELERSIGELGLLPEETLTSFVDETTASLSKKLTTVNENLKKYNHVNKKAIEQFAKFAKQRDSLCERLGELASAKESIEHLMEVLQDRKNEAIVRTFKEVSVGFSKIFEKLVPSGKGKLIIQKKTKESKDGNTIFLSQYADTNDKEQLEDGNEESATDSSEEEEEINSIDSFVGISISVSFNSKKNEQQRLEQLSGGQKSLCALSLILAIQNCDPAPFYLFDEIDSNLDAQYRTAVASLIQRLSRNAQFICTTFRSEMLKVSDRYYGVMFNNKVSTVSNIDANRALDFVEDQQRV